MNKLKAQTAIWLLRMLSRFSLKRAQAFGAWVGRILWQGDSKPTRVTKKNIELCFPEMDAAQQQALIKASLEETCKVFFELGAMWEWPTEKALGLIRSVEGKEYFDAASAHNRGLIVLAPHHGNWELVGLYLSSLRPMAALYKPPKIPQLEEYMSSVRGRQGSELVPTDKRGVIRLFSILNDKGMVGILPDQVPGGTGGVYAPFFGVPANTVKLVSRLIQKTGCEVVSLCAMRRPDGDGFDMIFRKADPEIYSDDIETSVGALNRSVEMCVRDRPEQYQWEYKRFKGARQNGRWLYKDLQA
ncbi:MAG: lipid A biosynthesis acyltransferase [Oleiphilus sp.]|nr:MAG: lipid A biosynthesis acyltransferase [Oleiphilus sp.]